MADTPGTAIKETHAPMQPLAAASQHNSPVRVLHFVTGGFSGATQVALDLVRAAQNNPAIEPLLVMRRKRQTPVARIEALRAEGIPVQTVSGLVHALSIWQLRRICLAFKPDVLVAHGFPEHLLGRHAGLLAGVPTLIQVEHNVRERYTAWRLAQTRWLAGRTAHIVGVSDGIKGHLAELGLPREKIISIPNGIDLQRFEDADAQPFADRAPDIVMCARFSAQKDHDTAIRAMALLAESGLRPRMWLAGGGKARHRAKAEALAKVLGLSQQVCFMGQCHDVPALLKRNQICLLSTHYEGMPLALIEGMAAGCAVIGSKVLGVQEVIEHERNGLLVREGDAAELAAAMRRLLETPDLAAALARQARQDACDRHGVELMRHRYEQLFVASAR